MNQTDRLFSPEILRAAEVEARRGGRSMPEVLQTRMEMEAESFLAAMGEHTHYPVLTMAQLGAMTPDFSRISFPEAAKHMTLELQDEEGKRWAVIGNPFDRVLLDWLDDRLKTEHFLALAHYADIAAFLARHEEGMRAMDGFVHEQGGAQGRRGHTEQLSLAAIAEDVSPVVRLVHSTLYDALKSGASDIHLESDTQGLGIKYRIDGVLNSVGRAGGLEMAEQIISRIKVMSELDISERRVPQDGRFRVTINGREVDFRVSIMPSVHGEDAVLRILDRQALTNHLSGLNLDQVGFDAEMLGRFRHLCREPYGMVLVTGPTGSGKTTTLYAAISEINSGRDKLVTIEDPVEYQLAGVLQIPVNEKKGLTFARGLRSILRHDPDKIMVGEIRDSETAQIAVQSALTGHLVFTTVHANNVFDVIGRFMQLGVDAYSFVSALNGILAQRLVRINCDHCTVDVQPGRQLMTDSGINPLEASHYGFRKGEGCGHCRGSGYKGRKAIGEMLNLNDELRELIAAKAPIRAIKEAAHRNGTRSLRDAALMLVRQGETTLEEINRVTFVA
ncbi:MAG TPA: GspE/PulE family protein [Thiobacillaceae bacterium]|nr:GspE/PulE family protein [Thiobacillaceae bacterium]